MIQKARERLLAQVDPTLSKLFLLRDKSEDDKVQLQACVQILNRIGLSEPDKVEVSGDGGGPIRFVLERIGAKKNA